MPTLFPELVAIPLRLALGAYFLSSGIPKWMMFKMPVKMMKKLHFHPAKFWAFILVATEVLGGLALILGFATRIAAALIAIAMTVAMLVEVIAWKSKFAKGWSLNVVLIAAAITLVLLGAGAYSVDSVIGWALG